MKLLPFEKPLAELYDKIEQLRKLSEEGNIDLSGEILKIEQRAEKLRLEIYKNLNPSQIVQIARHPNRPDSGSLIRLIFDTFIELHGDRLFADDPAIVGGVGTLGAARVVIVGHQKGHDTKENIFRNFGMPNPDGYRKALRLMQMAERFRMPIITFIDTPGAYPGLEAEERGQAEAIARNLREMAGFSVPIISFVIGEGGSGGALGIGVANKLYMLENAVYSVISPEGCASILFRDAKKADVAANAMKITAPEIVKLGVADGIIPEPLGGGHHDWKAVAFEIERAITSDLDIFKSKAESEIKQQRYDKFRKMGVFVS
ncbi:acetyl-CoA carboxylase carboxyltransferase subunit alpha [bacterium]|nr:acetyl-CoA carboxylase carboxyltransferase subunit alpha [bacterium]